MTKAGKYWIPAIVLAVLGLVEAVTGILGFIEGESGAGKINEGTKNLTYGELTKHTWIDVHDWVAVALVVLVILHFGLHGKWILRVGRKLFTGSAGNPAVRTETTERLEQQNYEVDY